MRKVGGQFEDPYKIRNLSAEGLHMVYITLHKPGAVAFEGLRFALRWPVYSSDLEGLDFRLWVESL